MATTRLRVDGRGRGLRRLARAVGGIGTIVVLGFATEAAAQAATGRVVGRVVDAQNSQPLVGAHVHVGDSRSVTVTDGDGRYMLLNVPAGTHSLVVQHLGYERKTIAGVAVGAGESVTVDVVLAPEAIRFEEITVTATRDRGSAAFLLDQRRAATALVDAIGSTEISRSPDSDAAEVAARMTGVTIAEGRYVHIRGLGERYSQTALNGSPLPSPEPERETVPLDLFPSGLLESVGVQKTYTPDQPGDFSGGTVAIATQDMPDRLTYRISIGTSANTRSQFRDGFLTYDGGRRDFLGIDDGTRSLPDAFDEVLGGLRGRPLPSDPALRERLGEALPRQFAPVSKATPMSRSIDFGLGNRTELLGRPLGFVLGGSYSDAYTLQDTEIERKYRSSAFDPTLPVETRLPNVDYAFRSGTRSVSWGGVAGLTLVLTPDHKLALKGMYNRNADDEARVFSGANREDLGGELLNQRLRFVSRSLGWAQVSGEHAAPLRSRLEWRASNARATRDEPMLREALYLRSFSAGDDAPYFLENVGESARYFFSELVDDDRSAGIDWRVPFPMGGGREGTLQLGGAFRERERDFAARRFHWHFTSATIGDLDASLTDEAIVGRARHPGEFELRDVVEPGDQYGAIDRRTAGYIMVDLPLTRSLRAIAGVRMEQYDLEITSRGATLGDRNRTDWLPALNLVYAAGDRMNLRAAVSRTLDRPEFRELAPFQFTEATSLRQIYGNPDLKQAEITSADLRWEWFPRPGELVSVGLFHKALDRPIEQVYIAAASGGYSFQNAIDGTIYGVELEFRQGLGAWADFLEPFSLQANLTLIESEVRVKEEGVFIPTHLERPLEGQAPYTLNASLHYQTVGGTELGVYYNVSGEKVAAAGGSGIPDIYAQPVHKLDVVFRQPLGGGLSLKFKADNLLDPVHRFEQSANGVTLTQREFREGRTFSVSVSYGR